MTRKLDINDKKAIIRFIVANQGKYNRKEIAEEFSCSESQLNNLINDNPNIREFIKRENKNNDKK